MIVICWFIGEIDELKVLQNEIIGNCLFSVVLSILAPVFATFQLYFTCTLPKIHYCPLTITKYVV
jgi:hypothetical protein